MEEDLKRIPHQPYSPDRSPCDFFLFGYPTGKFTDQAYRTAKGLFSEVERIISEITSAEMAGEIAEMD
jgi:hypothetical protein